MSTLPPKVRVGGFTGGAAKDGHGGGAAAARGGGAVVENLRGECARRVRELFSFLWQPEAALRVLAARAA